MRIIYFHTHLCACVGKHLFTQPFSFSVKCVYLIIYSFILIYLFFMLYLVLTIRLFIYLYISLYLSISLLKQVYDHLLICSFIYIHLSNN